MHQEVTAAVSFILNLLRLTRQWTPDQLEALRQQLQQCLYDRYRGHWYPHQPYRGQGYRCIRINASQPPDTSLLAACVHCGIDYTKLGLPEEFTLWIDPYEVCGRYAENSKCFTIAMFPKETYRPPTPSTTSDYSSGSTSPEPVSENSSDDELTVKDQASEMECLNETKNPSSPVEVEHNLDVFWQVFFETCDQDSSLKDSRFLTVWKNVQAPTAAVGDDSPLE